MSSDEYIDLFQKTNCVSKLTFFPEPFNLRQKQFVLNGVTSSLALKLFNKHSGCLLFNSTVCVPYLVCVCKGDWKGVGKLKSCTQMCEWKCSSTRS
jgi:hypothetical protein